MKRKLILVITIFITTIIISHVLAEKNNLGEVFHKSTPLAAGIYAPTPTSISALAQSDMQTLHLDFDHPILHTISNSNPLVIDELRRIDFETEYVAIIVETFEWPWRKALLIFNITSDGESVLIYEKREYSIYIEISRGWLVPDNLMQFDTGGFSDHNQNGLPELVVNISNGGNCYDCRSLLIVEIISNDHAKDITPISDFTPKDFITNDLGEIRLLATHFYESQFGTQSRAGSPHATRLFAWDETFNSYIDVSHEEIAYYDKKIDMLKKGVESTFGQPLSASDVMPKVAMILFAYEVSGRLEYGWNEIQSLIKLENWNIQNTSPDEIDTYHQIFDLLEERIATGTVIKPFSVP